MKNNDFGLTSSQFLILENLLIKPLKAKAATVWIFGSRARKDHNIYSDIDVLYEVNKELPPGYIFEITSDLEESPLPYKVDIVCDKDLAQSYRKNVFKDRIRV